MGFGTGGSKSAGFGAKKDGEGGSSGQPATPIDNKVVSDILSEWREQLARHLEVFSTEARRVSKWDELVRADHADIQELATEVHGLKMKQQEMRGQLQAMEAEQGDMDRKIADLEAWVDEQFERLPSGGHTSDRARLEAYRRAKSLDTQLTQMGSQLRALAETCNERFTRSRTAHSEDGRVENVRQILTEHTRTMRWVDNEADRLRHHVARVRSKLRE